MIAKRIPSILPPLTLREAIETTKVHSICGLNYQIGDTSYSGPKHQVLQQLTQRQTEIGVDLQRDHLQSAVDELDKARQVAADQKAAADAHLKGAQIDGQIAALDQQHANEMLQSFDSQFFTPEQWWAMAMFMRGLSS